MPNWMSYAYCGKCKRPLRWNEHRLLTTGAGNTQRTTYFCWHCDSEAWKPITFLGFYLWNFLALSACISAPVVMIWVYYSWQSGNKETAAPNWAGICAAFLFVIMVSLVKGCFEKDKSMRIYNLWVKRHGADPSKWPSEWD